MRISATDWTEGGWDADQSVRLAAALRERGVDLVDTSTGGNVLAEIPVGPGYQVPFARQIREQAQIPTGAVGLILEPQQAEKILAGRRCRCRAAGAGGPAGAVLAAAGRRRAGSVLAGRSVSARVRCVAAGTTYRVGDPRAG